MSPRLHSKFFTGALLAAIAFAHVTFAADLTVTPAVIDGHGLPRDILSYTITVTNQTSRQENVFVSVYEITASGTQAFGDPSIADRSASLANWIEVSRGSMTFAPGESKSIPVTITINPYATAGDYHAIIAFVEGGTRADAEQHLDGAPQAIVNMSVASDAKAVLQIDGFGPVKHFYSAFPIDFSYTMENTGDVPLVPTGLILFYDRTGHEIGSLDANSTSVSIAPGEKHDFSARWESGKGLGQYKAVLSITYGPSSATLESVALFWILPWQKLLFIFIVLLLAVIVLSIFVYKQYEKRHHRRMRAIQHLLKDRSVLDLRHPHKKND